jgi:predicted  nucleic acid-binding Zn-ribbon protein
VDLTHRRETSSVQERELGSEVNALSAKVKEVEETLYSGSVRAPKELGALQEEIRLFRVRQSELEERELELLEEIERTDEEMAANRAARMAVDSEAQALEARIREAEAEIDAELAELGKRRDARATGLPPDVLVEYDRLRTRERLGGRAAAPLVQGSCGACRVKLPVLEHSRIRAEPEDALVCCMHCGRVLVR